MVNLTAGYLLSKKRQYLNGKSLTWKKFLCFLFFGLFATQLLLLRDRSSDANRETLKNFWHGDGSVSSERRLAGGKSYHQFVDDYLHQNRTFDRGEMSSLLRFGQNNSSIKQKIFWRKIEEDPPRIRVNVTKVLLLTPNPRSGSSFTGELISTMPNVSYFFEPLWFFGNSRNNSNFNEERNCIVVVYNH
jgi:hypothetical protein